MPSGAVDERLRNAMRLYAEAIAIVDPIRIRMWSEAELTTGQLRLMFFLRVTPGAVLGDLAAHLAVSAPTASGLVDRLTRAGYVRREEAEHDRRYNRHHLTNDGEALVTELEREGRAFMGEILARFDDAGLDELTRSLERLVEAARLTEAARS